MAGCLISDNSEVEEGDEEGGEEETKLLSIAELAGVRRDRAQRLLKSLLQTLESGGLSLFSFSFLQIVDHMMRQYYINHPSLRLQ